MTPGKSRQWIDECIVYIKVIKGAVLFPGRGYLLQLASEGVLLYSGELSLIKQEKPLVNRIAVGYTINACACTDMLRVSHNLYKTVGDKSVWHQSSVSLSWCKKCFPTNCIGSAWKGLKFNLVIFDSNFSLYLGEKVDWNTILKAATKWTWTHKIQIIYRPIHLYV